MNHTNKKIFHLSCLLVILFLICNNTSQNNNTSEKKFSENASDNQFYNNNPTSASWLTDPIPTYFDNPYAHIDFKTNGDMIDWNVHFCYEDTNQLIGNGLTSDLYDLKLLKFAQVTNFSFAKGEFYTTANPYTLYGLNYHNFTFTHNEYTTVIPEYCSVGGIPGVNLNNFILSGRTDGFLIPTYENFRLYANGLGGGFCEGKNVSLNWFTVYDPTKALINIKSVNNGTSRIINSQEPGTHGNSFNCKYALDTTLVLNSTYFTKENTRVFYFTNGEQITNNYYYLRWVESTDSIFQLNSPWYKLRITDLVGNIIFEDTDFQEYSYYRSLDLDSIKIQNNSPEPIFTEFFDYSGTLYSQNYTGAYSFENDVQGSNAVNFTCEVGLTSTVNNSVGNHAKVLQITAASATTKTNYVTINKTNTDLENGTLEFWGRVGQTTGIYGFFFWGYHVASKSWQPSIPIFFFSDTHIRSVNAGTWTSTSFVYEANRWYHFKISFDCSDLKHSLWIDGVSVYSNWGFYDLKTVSNIQNFSLRSDTISTTNTAFLDALDYSSAVNYTVGRNIVPVVESTEILSTTSSFNLTTNPYSSTISNITSATYLVRISDLYNNTLTNYTISSANTSIAYTPPNFRQCFISLSDSRDNYENWENFKIRIDGTLIYSNTFYREINQCVNISIYSSFDRYLNSTLYTVTRDENYIHIIIPIFSFKIYNQQERFVWVNMTRNPVTSEQWSEWLAPSESTEYRISTGSYNVNVVEYESNTTTNYAYTINNDTYCLVTSSNTIYNAIYNIQNTNSSVQSSITNVSIFLSNENSALNQSIINLDVYLNSTNSTISTLLISQNVLMDLIDSKIDNLTLSQQQIMNITNSIFNLTTVQASFLNTMNSTIHNLIVDQSSFLETIDSNITNFFFTQLAQMDTINSSIITQIWNQSVYLGLINASLSNISLEQLAKIEGVNSTVASLFLAQTEYLNLFSSNLTNFSTQQLAKIDGVNNTISSLILNQDSVLGMIGGNITTLLVNQSVLFNLTSEIQTLLISQGAILNVVNSTIANMTMTTEQTLSIANSIFNLTTVQASFLNTMNSTIHNLIVDQSSFLETIDSNITNYFFTQLAQMDTINSSIISQIWNQSVYLGLINSSIVSQALTNLLKIEGVNSTISQMIISQNQFLSLFNSSVSDLLFQQLSNISGVNSTITNFFINQNAFLDLIQSNITNLLVNQSALFNISSDIQNMMIAQTAFLNLMNSTIADLFSNQASMLDLLNSSISSLLLNQTFLLDFTNSSIQSLLTNQSIQLEALASNLGNYYLEQIAQLNAVNSSLGDQLIEQALFLALLNSSLNSMILDQMLAVESVNSTIVELMIEQGLLIMNTNSTIVELMIDQILAIENFNSTIVQLLLQQNAFISAFDSNLTSVMIQQNILANLSETIENLLISQDIYLNVMNSTLVSMLVQQSLDINVLSSDINTLFLFTNQSFLSLNNSIYWTYIQLDNSIMFIDSQLTVVKTTIENQLYLLNSSIYGYLINNVSTSIYELGNNISNQFNQLTQDVFLINNTIYTAIATMQQNLTMENNYILGNQTIMIGMNEYLTQLYQKTLFSEFLNWTDVARNATYLEDQIWNVQFMNNYRNQSVTLLLRYQNETQELDMQMMDSMNQWLPKEDIEFRVKDLEGNYLTEWEEIKNKSIVFGNYTEVIPATPADLNAETNDWILIIVWLIGFAIAAVFAVVLIIQRTKKQTVRHEIMDTSRTYRPSDFGKGGFK